jgi:hypothetical protein
MDLLAEFCCSRKTYEMVFKPLLADYYAEYVEAVARRRPWRARWLRVVYVAAFLSTGVTHKVAKVIDVIRKVSTTT